MRHTWIASIFAMVMTSASAQPAVDLGEPGALDALRERNPRHHDSVTRILAAAREVPHTRVRQAITVRYDASDVRFEPLVSLSDPPKMKLFFTLDAVRYSAVVVPNFLPATLGRAAEDRDTPR